MKQVLRLISLVGVWAVIVFLGLRWIIQPEPQVVACPLDGFADPTERITIHDIMHMPGRYPFGPLHSPLAIARHTPFWFRITVSNQTTNPLPVCAEATYASLNSVDTYVVDAGQRIRTFPHESWRTPFANRAVNYQAFAFPVTIPPNQVYTIYIRLQRQIGNIRFAVQVWTADGFVQHEASERLLWGLMIGWLLLAISFGLILFGMHGDRLYLLYSTYVFLCLISLLAIAGYLREYAVEMYLPESGQFVRSVTIQLAVFGNMFFVRTLLQSRKYAPGWLFWSSNWFAYLIGISCILVTLTGPVLNRMNQPSITLILAIPNLTITLIVLYSVCFIGYGIKHPSSRPLSGLYLAAFIPAFLTISEFSSNLLHDSLGINDMVGFYAFAVVFDTTVLLFGLAYRFKLYRDERETALREQRNIAMQTLYVERSRLARELHDYIGPDLAVLKMQMEGDQEQPSSLSEQQLDLYIGSLNRILTDVRQVSHALLPTGLQETNLVTGLTQFIDTLSAVPTNPEISFVYDLHTDLPPFMQQSVFQITKELVLNAVKHAQASLVDVELYDQDNTLHLTVADDGRGYNPDGLSLSEGIGLRNLEAIIELLNGNLAINPKKQQGMIHQIVLPIN